MMSDSMKLTTRRDAYTWAANMGNFSDAQIERLGDWIWENKPEPNCRYEDHPIRDMDSDEFWAIVGDE